MSYKKLCIFQIDTSNTYLEHSLAMFLAQQKIHRMCKASG